MSLELFNRLDLDVVRKIFENRRGELGVLIPRKISHSVMSDLRITADDQALACLITILMLKIKKTAEVSINLDKIRRALFEHLINLCATNYFTDWHDKLLKTFYDIQNIKQYQNPDIFRDEFIAEGLKLISYKKQLLTRLCHIGIRKVNNGEDKRFLALSDLSNKSLLLHEITVLTSSIKESDNLIVIKAPKDDFPLADNSERGLMWVISKINNSRSKSDQIKRFVKDGELILLLRESAKIDLSTWSKLID